MDKATIQKNMLEWPKKIPGGYMIKIGEGDRVLMWFPDETKNSGENDAFLSSGAHPFPNGKPSERHNKFDQHGRWIGDDLRPMEQPHRIITNNCIYTLGANECVELFARYQRGDYGDGEAGFAVYRSQNDGPVWIIDDAVRSPEGEPPARDPRTSPGPQTMLFPEDY